VTLPAAAAETGEPQAAAPAPLPAPAPTPEEQKKAEEAKRLAEDRAKMEAESQAELARFTPELRKETAALATRKYPTFRAGLEAALKSPHRKPGHSDRDAARHASQMIEFFGLKPNMTVLEISPGEGWFTELLAPVLASSGKLLVTSGDPNAPKSERGTLYAERTQLFLQKSPELYGKVERIIINDKAPDLKLESKLDAVLAFRTAHGWVQRNQLSAWLSEIHEALKPGGVLAIEQHRGLPDADPAASAKTGYVPEPWLIAQIEAAGFKLAAKSEMNANPKDTKDHPEGVWALPPTLRLKEKDRAKYVAIGESDRMTLRFVKVAAAGSKTK
jgi:predicted methyltransferase